MKRILFVDDEPKLLDGIRRMMHTNRHRWNMQFLGGGVEALAAFESGAFDVVVSDIRMPGMDGITLLRHVRDRFPETARIILSGYSDLSHSTMAAAVAHQVLSKPCNAEVLQSTIERLFTLQEVLCTPATREVVGGIGTLPSLSSTFNDLRSALDNNATSISRISEIIERDIAMTAKVLQLVNSAFFGLSHKVMNVTGAVAYLGMETIKSLALTADIFRAFKPDPRFPANLCEDLHHHALHTSVLVKIAQPVATNRETVAVVALLHDIGKLVLASKLPEQYCSVVAHMHRNNCGQYEAEQEILGTTHAEVGAYLLGLWGISNGIVEAVAHHHNPTRLAHPDSETAAAIYISDLLLHEFEPAMPRLPNQTETECLKALGVAERFPEMREQARLYFSANAKTAE